MRALVIRLTVVSATCAAFLSGLLTAATRAPWILVMVRAAVAFALVLAVGLGFGLILMRTALRRRYEEALTASRRARGNR